MYQPAVANQSLKETNLIRVFLALKEGSPLTKNALCSHLNLSRPTVDTAITRLLTLGLVAQNGRGPSEGGRRAILYTFNERARYAVGGDLELPELNLSLCGLAGPPIASIRFTVPEKSMADPGRTLAFVSESVARLLEDAKVGREEVVGVGLGIPAFLKGDTVTISGRNLPQWERVPVKSTLEELLNVPVYVDNDVNFMALSENHAMGYQDRVMSYIALRRGLKSDIRMGGSTLIDGKVFHGGSGNAASLQHAYVEVQDLRKQEEEAAASVSASRRLASLVALHLIEPITHMIRLFDPNRLVINAAILGPAEEAFVSEITARLDAELKSEFAWEIEVSMAEDRRFGSATGGALFVLQQVFNRPVGLIKGLTVSRH